jgi:hypothetical protein
MGYTRNRNFLFLSLAVISFIKLLSIALAKFNDLKINRRIYSISLLLILFSIIPFRYGNDSTLFDINTQNSKSELYCWIKTHTPQDTILLAPEGFSEARFLATRALIVDIKCTPYKGSELLEWYERISAIYGFPKDYRKANIEMAQENYNNIDSQKALKLSSKYGVTHMIIIKNEHKGKLSDLKVDFQNTEYIVYNLIN